MESFEQPQMPEEQSGLLSQSGQSETSTEHAHYTLESLRQLPLHLDRSYEQPVAEALKTLKPGIYERRELMELVDNEAARLRREQSKIIAALHGSDRIMQLQENHCYVEPATSSSSEKEQLVSTRVKRLVDCLQTANSYNKELELGDCMVMANTLGILPPDSRDRKLFERLFVRHPRIRIEGNDQKVYANHPEWRPPATIGDALDKLTRVAKTTVLSERMLVDRSADFVALDNKSKKVLAEAFTLDKRFTPVGRTRIGNVYKLWARHDPDNVNRLQQAAESYVTALREQGDRHHVDMSAILRDANDKGYTQRLNKQQQKIFSLLIESQPGVSLLRARGSNSLRQFLITSTETSAPAFGHPTAENFALAPAPTPTTTAINSGRHSKVPTQKPEIPEELSGVIPSEAPIISVAAITSEAPLESAQQRNDRLTRLASQIIERLIDKETITMPAAHLLEFARAHDNVEFSAGDEEIILSHIAQHSRLRRIAHHTIDLFVEKSVPEKYTYDEQDENYESQLKPAIRRPGGSPRRLPHRLRRTGKLVDINSIGARDFDRIKRIEELLDINNEEAQRNQLESRTYQASKINHRENRRRKKHYDKYEPVEIEDEA